jgi:hypothetical protein
MELANPNQHRTQQLISCPSRAVALSMAVVTDSNTFNLPYQTEY